MGGVDNLCLCTRVSSNKCEPCDSKWGIFLFTLAAPVPFSMPSLNKTQHGIVVMEGFFNGPLDEAQSTFEPLSSFKPEWQLSCEVKSISSFREWHNTRWFGKGFPYSQTQASRFPQRTGADTASLAKVTSGFHAAPCFLSTS